MPPSAPAGTTAGGWSGAGRRSVRGCCSSASIRRGPMASATIPPCGGCRVLPIAGGSGLWRCSTCSPASARPRQGCAAPLIRWVPRLTPGCGDACLPSPRRPCGWVGGTRAPGGAAIGWCSPCWLVGVSGPLASPPAASLATLSMWQLMLHCSHSPERTRGPLGHPEDTVGPSSANPLPAKTPCRLPPAAMPFICT